MKNMAYSLHGKKQRGAGFPGFSIKKGHAMIYLTSITFPSGKKETEYILKCGGSSYPYHVISSFGLKKIDFEPVTILYGNNGSGKSTVLHIIAEITKIHRDSLYNTSAGYPGYAAICDAEIQKRIPDNSTFALFTGYEGSDDIRSRRKACDDKALGGLRERAYLSRFFPA